jgi:signal transduction histidine kinase
MAEEQPTPHRAPDTRRSLLLRLALATALVQAIFWFGIRPLLYGPPSMPPLYALSDVQEATLSPPDAAALEQARFTPTELPWSSCCSPGYRALRFNVSLPQVPEGGVAMVPQAQADNLHIYVNGRIAHAPGRLAMPHATYDANVKGVIYLPPALFRPGANRVDFVMVRQAMPYFDVGKPLFADYAIAWPLFKFRNFVLTEFEYISVAVGVVIAVVALVLLMRSSQRAFALSLLVLASAWSLLTQFYFWVDPPFSAAARMFYYFVLTNALPAAWLYFSDQWTGRPLRWSGRALLLVYATSMGITYWLLQHQPVPDGFDNASDLANWFGIALSALAIARFLWHVFGSGEDRVWEFAVFALCITLVAADLISELLWDKTAGYLIRGMPMLLLAFVVAFLARNVRLFQSTHEINRLLSARLQAREAELAETHRRESDLVRREAHQAERQRLMRDMHDGVGHQLTSMLFAARRGALSADHLVESLQTVIEEIRLLIDSMDSGTDSLASALEAFQQRAARRLEAAGVALDFKPVPREWLPACGPREVLHILRILQEGVSNALRHAQCTRIAIEITPSEDASLPVQVIIRDDGVGFPAEVIPGRGLSNMESRAAAIGGRLTIDRSGPGVALRLLFGGSRAETA